MSEVKEGKTVEEESGMSSWSQKRENGVRERERGVRENRVRENGVREDGVREDGVRERGGERE